MPTHPISFSCTAHLLLICCIFSFSGRLNAQGPTLVITGDCGIVSQNFNTNNGGFSSPSLYSPASYKQFIYTPSIGYWNMTGPSGAGISINAPAAAYNVSIISPVYFNPNPAGHIDIGFYYEVPNAAADAYQIRIFDVRQVGGLTQFNLVANTEERPFPVPGAGPTVNSGPLCVRLQDEDITNATPYRIEISYLLQEGGNATFDNFSLGKIQEQPLPVTFFNITANKTNTGVNVRWEVGEEQQVARYEVERSQNGRDYVIIGRVVASAQAAYSFTDAAPANGINFYRVRNIDTDGRFKYSASVKVNLSKTITLQGYPLPATGKLTLEHNPIAAKTAISITAIDGRTLKTIYALPGTTKTEVDLSGWSSGVYIIRLQNGVRPAEMLKVIKQ